ncbi:MAG: hypothetical protein J6Z35_06420 [Lachnospiraceae bacterium]|nr:hypothetical protein [Lachnospiraceae bacterium]
MLKGNGNRKIIVGYDLGYDYAQISYCDTEGTQVETVSAVAGADAFCIPVVLCKREGVNQWFYGKEAWRYARENQGILIENLVQLSLAGEMIRIEEEEYDPVALLTLFFKRSLGMLSGIGTTDQIEALMITCERLDDKMLGVLEKVAANLRLKTRRIAFQSYQESFYFYMLNQPQELWKDASVLFDYHGSRMSCFRMECNPKTQPVVMLIQHEEEEFPSRESLSGQEDGGRKTLDETFLKVVQEKLENRRTASVYLIGDDFSEDWLKSSLRYLCDRRRIFLGNNLFSKGACYGMAEHFNPSDLAKEYVYLGEDKLKSNVGIRMMRRGEETYLALLDAGTPWRNASAELEFYVREDNTVELTVTSLSGGGKRLIPVVLEQLSGEIARIRMTLQVEQESLLAVEFEDLGFGEFRPAENRRWRQEIALI